jgi:hypothetical protein
MAGNVHLKVVDTGYDRANVQSCGIREEPEPPVKCAGNLGTFNPFPCTIEDNHGTWESERSASWDYYWLSGHHYILGFPFDRELLSYKHLLTPIIVAILYYLMVH